MRILTVNCHCFYCLKGQKHPASHEDKFERKSNLPSDELEPGAAVEFCSICGHERLVEEKERR